MTLNQFEAQQSDDSVKTALELTCTSCHSVLCDIEDGDTLGVLVSMTESHICASNVCKHCGEDIRQDDNGAGGTIWVHDHGSTVCGDSPAGTIDDGPTAEPQD